MRARSLHQENIPKVDILCLIFYMPIRFMRLCAQSCGKMAKSQMDTCAPIYKLLRKKI